jgi:hypothetical protein
MAGPQDVAVGIFNETDAADDDRHGPDQGRPLLDAAGLQEHVAADEEDRRPVDLGHEELVHRVAGAVGESDGEQLHHHQQDHALPDQRDGVQALGQARAELLGHRDADQQGQDHGEAGQANEGDPGQSGQGDRQIVRPEDQRRRVGVEEDRQGSGRRGPHVRQRPDRQSGRHHDGHGEPDQQVGREERVEESVGQAEHDDRRKDHPDEDAPPERHIVTRIGLQHDWTRPGFACPDHSLRLLSASPAKFAPPRDVARAATPRFRRS